MLKKATGTLTVLMILAFISGCTKHVTKQADIDEISRSRVTELDRAFLRIIKQHKINTVGVAVIKEGRMVWQNQYGMQSENVPASENTLFNVASITKTVTAETILRLAAQKKLALDEPMTDYWLDPDLKNSPEHRQLTAKMALSHTGGFMNWRYLSEDRKLSFISSPGERFNYSGEGFEYLAKYAEEKLGQPFEQLVQSMVFSPLGINSASLSVREDNYTLIAKPLDASNQFYGYYCWPAGWCKKPGDFSAAGSMVITVADYAKFMISSMRGEGLDTQLARDRNTIIGFQDDINCAQYPELICPVTVGYGLGWYIADLENDKLIGHRGSDWSVVSAAYYYQNSGDGLIIFLNAPNKAGIAAMVDALELLDPDSPELHGYRTRRDRINNEH